MLRVDAFLQLGREQGGSDVHLVIGRPPLVRLDGELTPIRYRELNETELGTMIDEMLSPPQVAEFSERGSLDLGYHSPDAGRFRINLCRQSKGVSVFARVIPDKVIPLAKLNLPRFVNSIVDLKEGLVLVTGATGTGKSTTLASIVNQINATCQGSIITLEDPIEFVHESDKCMVAQREVGVHIPSFAAGLRAALRQDPNVILIGEMRDLETISLALEAAETGHLVLGTLHTRGAVSTIDRVLDAFPYEAHGQVRNSLADNLRCVLSQELVRAADGRGRHAAVEILINTSAVSQLIREGKAFQIPNAISIGRRLGMQLMDQALLALVQSGDADPEAAFKLAVDKRPFQSYVTSMVQRSSPGGAVAASGSAVAAP